MTINQRDLFYWYQQFRTLLSGWTTQEQIQFHHYAIQQLQDPKKKGGHR